MAREIIHSKSAHPCFNKDAKGSCGRVHLPVAPKCNVQCNFCDRRYDCVNESRPGVTSSVISPDQAVAYMDKVLEAEPRITVAGIAGPGDPFANPLQTLETMRKLKKKYPQLLFCLASNGLNMPAYLDEMVEAGVSHATVTVNGVDPDVVAKVYSWIRDGNVIYRGREAAELLIERQMAAIKGLLAHGLMVKVNTILIPTINDHHVVEVAKTVGALGVDLFNLMPMKPNPGTVFGDLPEPDAKTVKALRDECEQYLPQMRHCKRCRADAVGLLDNDLSGQLAGCLSECASMKKDPRPYVAVATREGMLVNLHLGEAKSFQIWTMEKDELGQPSFRKVEERVAPTATGGPKRWYALAETLKDCRAVLVSAFGDTPGELLTDEGVAPVAMSGFIEQGLTAIYNAEDLTKLKNRTSGGCVKAGGCSGGGEGC